MTLSGRSAVGHVIMLHEQDFRPVIHYILMTSYILRQHRQLLTVSAEYECYLCVCVCVCVCGIVCAGGVVSASLNLI